MLGASAVVIGWRERQLMKERPPLVVFRGREEARWERLYWDAEAIQREVVCASMGLACAMGIITTSVAQS